MTVYTKQTWSDNNPSFPASAARFAHMEDGIFDASVVYNVAAGLAAPGAAVTSAITALGAAGGDVVLGPGVHTWESVPKLPNSLTGQLRIRGSGAIVVLTAGAPRMFDLNRTANDQIFRRILLEDFEVDAGNIGGTTSHIIVGSVPTVGTWQARVNVDGITIRRVKGYNAPPGNGTDARHWIYFAPFNNAGDGSTCYLKNIVCEDVDLVGGLSGIDVVAILGSGQTATTGSDYTVDNITYNRCTHDTGVNPTAVLSGAANFFIGGRAHGGRGRIRDCYGRGSADVGIETDAMRDMVVEATIEDAWTADFYHTNQNTPTGGAGKGQRLIWRHPTARRTGFALPTSDTFNGKGFLVTPDANFGSAKVKIEKGTWYRSTAEWHSIGEALTVTPPAGVGYDIEVDGLDIVRDGISVTPAAGTTPADIYFAGRNGQTAKIRVRGLRHELTGAQSGANLVKWYSILLQGDAIGANYRFTLDGQKVNFGVTGVLSGGLGSQTVWGIYASLGTFPQYLVRDVQAEATTDTTPALIAFNGTASVSLGARRGAQIEECDLSVLPGGQLGIYWQSASNVFSTTMKGMSFPGSGFVRPVAITVTASPFSWTNDTGQRQRVIVQGGTVSQISYSNWSDGVTFTDVGVVAGMVIVEPGDVLKTTYTVAPTMSRTALLR